VFSRDDGAQHLTVPLTISAHEFPESTSIAIARFKATTGTGVDDGVELPFPSSPSMFEPQHLAVPFYFFLRCSRAAPGLHIPTRPKHKAAHNREGRLCCQPLSL